MVVGSSFKMFLNEIKELPSRLAFTQNRPFVTVELAITASKTLSTTSAEGNVAEEGAAQEEGSEGQRNNHPPLMAIGALFVTHTGEWPLPEGVCCMDFVTL